MSKEGMLKMTMALMLHQINKLANILEDLKKNDYHVIVECQELDDPVFCIGGIKRLNKASVGIRYYDPTGLFG